MWHFDNMEWNLMGLKLQRREKLSPIQSHFQYQPLIALDAQCSIFENHQQADEN